MKTPPNGIEPLDEVLASTALALMTLIPLIEMALRPVLGAGVEIASVLVQHLGLVLTMMGALAAQRHGHLTSLGNGIGKLGGARFHRACALVGRASVAMICGLLGYASWRFVETEIGLPHALAYGAPVWWVQMFMPVGFVLLGVKLGAQCAASARQMLPVGVALTATGVWLGVVFYGSEAALWPGVFWLLAILLTGAPIFSVLGGLALLLFWHEGQPLASVALSQYQITVNPSLPALPLFTLAGLVFARTGAALRLGAVFIALFGGSPTGTVVAAAVLCSFFTAFTGGSGVTILALGGLLLPMLRQSGLPEQRGIGLVTSASALGVLLAPSVPLIMYAIIARVPINTMFLAGVVPALVMVFFLITAGGFLRPSSPQPMALAPVKLAQPSGSPPFWHAFWAAKWEIGAPVIALGSLVSGLTTPTETAALTTAYAIVTQGVAHRELNWEALGKCLTDCTQIIGGVMLILGTALGLTNFLVDSGLPNDVIDWVQGAIPEKWIFLIALNFFLLAAGAFMEIYAAIVFLVPLLLPVATSYGIDPVHFGIIFLANMEMGFLAPPAGMNLYFASAMFGKPIRYIAVAVLPALLAIFLGSLAISWIPWISTGLASDLGGWPSVRGN